MECYVLYLLIGKVVTASEYHRQVGENATLVSIDKAGHQRILASLVEENGGQHS